VTPRAAAQRVVDRIIRGGLAVVPFDVSYAFLGGTAEPLSRIYKLKLRPASKPCPILASWAHFADVAGEQTEATRRIERVVQAGLPVGVLARVNWESSVIQAVPDDCIDRLVKDDKVALFMNMGGVSAELIRVADERGVILFGSSANISGKGNSFALQEVPESMLEAVDILCEDGRCKYANAERLASSIVDLETGALTRRGILHEDIERLLADEEAVLPTLDKDRSS
jgi:tRNA A37 threonylcarbamoyladenosine synthetase subunit TsaC/SUA5/YrdC